MSMPLRVLITGAAGQTSYSLVSQIAKGDAFGENQGIVLVLLDIPPMKSVLEGVQMELEDCVCNNLHRVEISTNPSDAFTDIDAAFLVGAIPRKEGMERRHLLAANVTIFKAHGQLLHKAKPTCKVVVVGNPANTNAYVCAKYAAPHIPARNITALTRLDQNRAIAQVAQRVGVCNGSVRGVIIWGNHSATQFADVRHATVRLGTVERDVYSAVNDHAWIKGQFITSVQRRGSAIIDRRKLSSAMSGAKAACDHMRDWFCGTQENNWVSMGVVSDGSYNIPEGIVYSFPCSVDPTTKEWKIVEALDIDDFSRNKMDITLNELIEERDEALAACQ